MGASAGVIARSGLEAIAFGGRNTVIARVWQRLVVKGASAVRSPVRTGKMRSRFRVVK
ncbi:MAG TPA: hypothetical protein V6D31_00240 [Candidatus Sericytochromatia bacterium]